MTWLLFFNSQSHDFYFVTLTKKTWLCDLPRKSHLHWVEHTGSDRPEPAQTSRVPAHTGTYIHGPKSNISLYRHTPGLCRFMHIFDYRHSPLGSTWTGRLPTSDYRRPKVYACTSEVGHFRFAEKSQETLYALKLFLNELPFFKILGNYLCNILVLWIVEKSMWFSVINIFLKSDF